MLSIYLGIHSDYYLDLFPSYQDLLDKVAKEIGEPIDHDHDPIHDQVRLDI